MIDTIATANYERFSSSVKEFVVYGSTIYPTDSWSFLGYFEANDKSELQVFPLTTSSWTKLRMKEGMKYRFVRVEWLTWHRDETMCTMSEFRVYGNNMMNAMLVLMYGVFYW